MPVLLLFFLSPALWAIQLFEVKTAHPTFNFLLVAKDHESAAEALNQFKNSVNQQPELSTVYSTAELNEFQIIAARPLGLANPDKPQVIVLANRGYDISAAGKTKPQRRINLFYQKLQQKNHLLILPVGMTHRFSNSERQELFQKMNSSFQGLLTLGGPDVDPELYSETNEHSIDINSYRDQLEFEVVKSWLKFKKGFTFGVCRGHQMIAAALGFKLVQHIENHGHEKFKTHAIEVLSTTSHFLKDIAPSGRLFVNSYHHQAVLAQYHPDIEIAAQALDGTVEALESKDGRIFTTQFHYEFMTTKSAKNIFEKISDKLRRQKTHQCLNLFN